MNQQPFALDRVDLSVQELASADTAADLFRALLQATRDVAPRAAIFLVRQGKAVGWHGLGYGPEVQGRLREFSQPLDTGWLGQVATDTSAAFSRRSEGVPGPDFGQPESSETVAGALRVQGKPIAFLMAERSDDQQPWFPHAISLLITLARLRLELTLASKKLDAAREEPAAAAPARTTPPQPAAMAAPSPPSTPPASSESGLAPVADARGDGLSPELQAAQRFAQLVATDIRLYNEEAVMLGREHGDLVKRLGHSLSKGKETFLQRHGDLDDARQVLHDALVQVLAGGDGNLIPTSTLD